MPAPIERQTFYTVFINGNQHDVTGRKRNKKGYVLLCVKTHPNSDTLGYVMEHRVVMEMLIGRYLTQQEIVHHKNGIKYDNRIENLEIMDHGEHTSLHHIGVKRRKETRQKQSEKAKERFREKKNHPFYNHIDEKLKELYMRGVSKAEIARRLGVTRKTVYNKIKYLNLEGFKNDE